MEDQTRVWARWVLTLTTVEALRNAWTDTGAEPPRDEGVEDFIEIPDPHRLGRSLVLSRNALGPRVTWLGLVVPGQPLMWFGTQLQHLCAVAAARNDPRRQGPRGGLLRAHLLALDDGDAPAGLIADGLALLGWASDVLYNDADGFYVRISTATGDVARELVHREGHWWVYRLGPDGRRGAWSVWGIGAGCELAQDMGWLPPAPAVGGQEPQ